jgi:periplasmic protein TonB
MRRRHFLLPWLVAVVALGAWQFWGHAGRALAPSHGNLASPNATLASPPPTAVDEGGQFPPASAAPGVTIPHTRPPQTRSASIRPIISPPPLRSPSLESPPEGAVHPAPPAPIADAPTSPAAESASGSGHGIAQETGDSASPDSSATDSREVSSSQSAADSPPPPPLVPNVPPRFTPPRVVDTAGIEYPGDAFRLTLRRQELGAELAVEGAEGIVVLRVLISADGVARSIDVAASSGSSVLDQAAAAAVRRWRFTPATRNDVPIDAYAVLRIRYVVR